MVRKRFYLTTAIDYPNSRPHIGTAFEKIGADVQARYRRMEGFDVHFLMGNDENTVKVSRRAEQLGQQPQPYCDEMARQFKDVWKALLISNDDFIQTSERRHHLGCQKFIQKVYDNGWIYKGKYEGIYCEGCEEFKTEKQIKEAGGVCPSHKTVPIRRSEPCYYFALSRFRDQLLKFYEENPDFIQPVTRRNEVVSLVENELLDVNISRSGESWGIPIPFDPSFTIYVWFDALLNYVTAIGHGTDEERFQQWWPADVHFIGKDITRFHCALWPAMCFAAGIKPPRRVFGHGFVYVKNEETGDVEKISKALGNAIEPMDIISQFSAEAFRHHFMRYCPFPGDGEFSWQGFRDAFNAELANKLGNLYSRVVKLLSANYGGTLSHTANVAPEIIADEVDLKTTIEQIQGSIESCQYNLALERLWQQIVIPANRYTDRHEPWKLVKVDRESAARVLFALVEQIRVVAILLKPFLPVTAETLYRSFNYTQPWETVSYRDAWSRPNQVEDIRLLASLENGNVKQLFPRIK